MENGYFKKRDRIKNFLKNQTATGIKKIVVVFDHDENGNGYSNEFLIYNSKHFFNAGKIETIRPKIKISGYPEYFIPALGLLYDVYKEETLKHLPECFNNHDVNNVINLIKANLPDKTGGVKEFFGSAAFLIGVCEDDMRTLAASYIKEIKHEYEFNIRYSDKMFIIGTKDIILGLLFDIKKGEKKEIMAAKFYKSIIDISVYVCKDLRELYGIGKVYIAGRMFEEDDNLKLLAFELSRNGFVVENNPKTTCR